MNCSYLECDFAQLCMGGLWTSQPEGCAVAGEALGSQIKDTP
jgi:hypothetical protein